jgi:hypothetical protein
VPQTHLLGIFSDGRRAAAAAAALRARRLGDVTAYAPAFDHHVDNALGQGPSRVRMFTLVGGLLGCAIGFGFPIYTVVDWPIITGGKPIVSIPPFVVIAFELTILFAALSTVVGFLWLARLPRLGHDRSYDTRFSYDRWGVAIACEADRAGDVRAHLTEAGAEEVRDALP